MSSPQIDYKVPDCPYYECKETGKWVNHPIPDMIECPKCGRKYTWFGFYTRHSDAPGSGVFYNDWRLRWNNDYGENPDRDRWAELMEVPGE